METAKILTANDKVPDEIASFLVEVSIKGLASLGT